MQWSVFVGENKHSFFGKQFEIQTSDQSVYKKLYVTCTRWAPKMF